MTTSRVTVPIVVEQASRRFGRVTALDGVSLHVGAGEIHALLGPNGAGKTTLLRLLSGLTAPSGGAVRVAGLDASENAVALRRLIGVVPSGDRTLYLRISGLENLVFFGRLHGLGKREARARALEVLEQVGLADAARRRANTYSHGMQKRLAVARALLCDPAVLLVDEATHDLDPDGARRVRELVSAAAARGAAVIWATQRLEEIRGFAHTVTLLDRGRKQFGGSVEELVARAAPRRFLVRLRNGHEDASRELGRALASGVTLEAVDLIAEQYLLGLPDDLTLGEVVASIAAAGVSVLDCREERSAIESVFLDVVGGSV